MNLIDESDIDYFLPLDSTDNSDIIKITNYLGKLGFMFNKFIYNDSKRNYYSFEKKNKETNNIEIELKVNFR